MNAFTSRIAPIVPFKHAQQARVLRAIVQPPKYEKPAIAGRCAGAAAAQAIRGSQIEAQRRARRAGA